VWVVCATAWMLGARGVSRRAVGAMTLLVAAYVIYRLTHGVGSPGLAERASGFGFRVLEPSELVARFGSHPVWFYAYNVVAAVSTVLFSEPKGGVWRFAYELTAGRLDAWTVVSVASSVAATLTLVWYVWSRRAALRPGTLERDDRIVLVFVAVLAANAVISYPYAKNIIMSPAGMFLAPAVFVAARRLVTPAEARHAIVAMSLLLVLTAGWTYRTVGTHYNLRRTAAEQRNEWAHVDEWLALQHMRLADADAEALRDALQRDAIFVHPTPSQLPPSWNRWFDIDW
jgi:hypothetical protein